MKKINLEKALETIDAAWTPRIVGDVNDCQIKLVRLQGDFEWHKHDLEDEAFLVLSGRFTMKFRDADVELCEGELIIVPRGTEHMPSAGEGCSCLLFEPATTLNTGNTIGSRTVRAPARLD